MSSKFYTLFKQQNENIGRFKANTGNVVTEYWKTTEATASDDDGVETFDLGESAITGQVVSGTLPCARNLTIVSNNASITSGTVKIYGTNIIGKEINEEFTLNGTTGVTGTKAFKTVKKIDLPAQTATPAKQVETMTVSNGAGTASGTITLTITASGLTGSPKAIALEVVEDDTASEVASKIAAALSEDTAVSELFDVTVSTANVVLTANDYRANDSTLSLTVADTDTTGVGAISSSTNTTSGVATDVVKLGYGSKLGLSTTSNTRIHLGSYVDGTVEDTAPTFTNDDDEIEKNTVTFNTALAGEVCDTTYIVR